MTPKGLLNEELKMHPCFLLIAADVSGNRQIQKPESGMGDV